MKIDNLAERTIAGWSPGWRPIGTVTGPGPFWVWNGSLHIGEPVTVFGTPAIRNYRNGRPVENCTHWHPMKIPSAPELE